MLARREAELIKQGGIRFMSQELIKTFHGRTLEAIKKQRQRPDHKEAVQEYLRELEERPASQSDDSSEFQSAGEEEEPEDISDQIAEYLNSLEPLEVEGFNW